MRCWNTDAASSALNRSTYTNRRGSWLICWFSWLVHCLIGSLVAWSVGWFVSWLFGWLVGWWIGWLIDWRSEITLSRYRRQLQDVRQLAFHDRRETSVISCQLVLGISANSFQSNCVNSVFAFVDIWPYFKTAICRIQLKLWKKNHQYRICILQVNAASSVFALVSLTTSQMVNFEIRDFCMFNII